jgi:putative toxin-antitoxin system antitoxin component (TIGR02293 family)
MSTSPSQPEKFEYEHYAPPEGSSDPSAGSDETRSYDSLGIQARSLDELICLLKENGLPIRSFDRLQEALGISATTLADTISIAMRTLRRRRKTGHFKTDESERLLRLARLFERASEVLGSPERARTWMKEPLPVLGGQSPLDYADTEPGAREVERVLGRIAHGVFS